MKALKRVDAIVAKVETWLLVSTFLVLLLLGLLHIVLRPFNIQFHWVDEVMRNITLWVGLVGASLATYENGHLNVDALTHFLSPRIKAIAGVFVNLAASFIAGVIAYSGWITFFQLIARLGQNDAGAKLPSGIPVAVWQVMIPIGFSLIALRFFFKSLVAIQTVKTGGEVHKISEDGAAEGEGKVRRDGGRRV